MTLTGHAPWDLTRGGRRSDGGKGDGWDANAFPIHHATLAFRPWTRIWRKRRTPDRIKVRLRWLSGPGQLSPVAADCLELGHP